MIEREYTVLCPFGGLGAGALGFLRAEMRLLDTRAKFRLLGGIDVDRAACEDFETLTGVHELCADVTKLTAADVRAAFGERAPDVVFWSPPCKGASGLLSEAKARTAKYRALNKLALVWVRLMVEAWGDAPPRLCLLENVPRIVTRAKRMLSAVKGHLRRAGYLLHEGFHDAGEIGGLAQHRRRYLLVARHKTSVPTLLYQPISRRVRGCGEVLGDLPMPNDPAAGPLHRLPKIGWLNWVRLALIPAGGDWRDLPGVLEDGQERREKFKRHAVEDWAAPVGTVGGSGSNGVESADPRPGEWFRGIYGVSSWDDAAATVTGGAAAARGRFAVADPRVHGVNRSGPYGVVAWDSPSATVTGAANIDNAPAAVADPRIRLRAQDGANVHHNKYSVADWTVAAPFAIVDPSGDGAPVMIVRDIAKAPPAAPVILADDGTWHRPLTTLELAVLQGLPAFVNGEPLRLSGTSNSAHRERIGNAVPVQAAQAIAEQMLLTMLSADLNAFALSSGGGVWVQPALDARESDETSPVAH